MLTFVVFSTTSLMCQVNILFIDHNNAFPSDQIHNNSNIYNRLLTTQANVTRISSIPATISTAIYDQVWIFGNPGAPLPSKLNPIVNFINAGGAVYIQSEVVCCNLRDFVDQLINLTVSSGNSISLRHPPVGGRYQAVPISNPCSQTSYVLHGSAYRPFDGVAQINVYLEATGSCNVLATAGDVVGVKFRACDMIMGQGALMSIGDINVFPNGGTCTSTGLMGSTNNFTLIDEIVSTLESSKSCTTNPTSSISMNATNDTTICVGDQWPGASFTSNPPGATFAWTNSNTSIGLGAIGTGNIAPFITTNNSGAPITSTIIVTPTLNGCPGTPDTFNITVNSLPVADAGLDTTICLGDFANIGGNPSAVGGSGGPYTYNWTPITGLSNPTIANPSVTLTQTGVISFQVTVTDGLGCSASDYVMVSSLPAEQCLDTIIPALDSTEDYSIYVPSAFTPDNNGLNDGFKPIGTGISASNYSFRIFNRWGEKIFESTSLKQAWFGNFKGLMVPSAVYIWRLECRANNGRFIKRTGHVTLIN